MKPETQLGCKAYELDPGDEFSFDEGATWVVAETVCDAPERDSQDTIINFRTDDGSKDTLRCDSYRHVLLQRNWKG